MVHNPRCGQCKHFIRHYVCDREGDYFKSIYGHCDFLRRGIRNQDTVACPRFEEDPNHDYYP